MRVEDTVVERPTCVEIRDDRDAGANVRAAGEDVRTGAVVVRAGTSLGAAHVGVLASVGCARPSSTGARASPSSPRATSSCRSMRSTRCSRDGGSSSSNSYSLEAAVRAAGGEPVPIGIAPDDPAALADRLRSAEGCDLILTCGGVSVGDFDYTRDVVTRLGGSLSLWRVRMRPGAPIGFGRLFGVPWLGLPGNPVSALVTFELFGRPLLRTLAGSMRPHRRTVPVVLDEEVVLRAPLTHFLRCMLADGDDGSLARAAHGRAELRDAHLDVVRRCTAHCAARADDGARRHTLRAMPLDGDFGGSADFPA